MHHLGALEAFITASEKRNFSEAGRVLGLSPSAVGKSISRLEDRLGTRLFHRSTRRVTLTSEGARYLERCRRVIAELEAAELEIVQSQAAPTGTLRVSLPLVGMLMMPTITAFNLRWPEIKLDLDFTDRQVEVIEEGFDVVVRGGHVQDSRLKSRIVGVYQFKIVGSPEYFARAGVPQVPKDLLEHSCLHHRFPTSGKLEQWPLRPDPEGEELALPQSVIASTIEPLIHFAEAGLGLACLPDFTIGRHLKERRLTSVMTDHLIGNGNFRVMWPTSRHMAPKVRVFLDFMAEHLFAAKTL
ncbi:LysR family transcriptional regulator [Roseovarius atlanticus]|uniref:LysR family transcriptional regulator n=1 Tax=Roseovarius atlanticus TaxID=1641875 RepID=UPI001C952FCC|nr:LysR family transcriptional regulator [Roseovarius atlanticus]MBY5989130.1 LysR family transcriptional regulator [Roseovarius atlanticus]MBY6124522.1 LysR family transcriptional regulator [Roseovarius atlanticus]MBY6149017.1 LysR family transcriptional regulator [Roseovarius atlanticus]